MPIGIKACQKCGVDFTSAKYGGGRLSKDQMPAFYAGLDGYMCLSVTEGLNNSVMEAGMMGVPVISTRCGAAEEMIRDGENGFLVDRNVEAVAEAIEKLKDEDLRMQMGEAMHQEIKENWTWATKIKEFENMFDTYFEMMV